MEKVKHILILGGGFTSDKRLNPHTLSFYAANEFPHENEVVTSIDFNKDANPTHVWDLNFTPWPINEHFPAHKYDEVHAYEILEHLGAQGDAKAFFDTFAQIWYALKKGGILFASCPSYKSLWAFGDPSHTRVINAGSLIFLSREQYKKQLGFTAMSDYRHFLVGDWEIASEQRQMLDDGEGFRFWMRAK